MIVVSRFDSQNTILSLNDETKDSACFTRKFYVKSAKAPARIGKGKLWLLDQLFKKHVYGVRAGGEKMHNVFHNQFLVALKRLQVDKQELVHKSANEIVMVSTYTRIKAIPIGHIRLINGDNLDTQTPMTSKTLGGVFVYLKIPTLFASVIFSSKALRTANFRWVAGSKSFCGYLRSDCCNACPPRKHFLITR
ncbi:unnamed protein product [Brassica oleracea]